MIVYYMFCGHCSGEESSVLGELGVYAEPSTVTKGREDGAQCSGSPLGAMIWRFGGHL